MKMAFDVLPCNAMLREKSVRVIRLNDFKTKALVTYGQVKVWVDIWMLEPVNE